MNSNDNNGDDLCCSISCIHSNLHWPFCNTIHPHWECKLLCSHGCFGVETSPQTNTQRPLTFVHSALWVDCIASGHNNRLRCAGFKSSLIGQPAVPPELPLECLWFRANFVLASNICTRQVWPAVSRCSACIVRSCCARATSFRLLPASSAETPD